MCRNAQLGFMYAMTPTGVWRDTSDSPPSRVILSWHVGGFATGRLLTVDGTNIVASLERDLPTIARRRTGLFDVQPQRVQPDVSLNNFLANLGRRIERRAGSPWRLVSM